MKEYSSLLKDIKNKKILPIYFIQGKEPFYMDKITEAIENNVLEEDQKDFNQHILYGLETKMDEIISIAKQYPFGSDVQLVIVKEAQNTDLDKEAGREALLAYVEHPQPQTVLVINFKNKTLNGNTKLAKLLKKNGQLFTSESVYENQLPTWIESHTRTLGMNIDHKSSHLLAEHLGNNLSSLDNELKKLKLVVGDDKEITSELIQDHIGISKDFNNFELNKAIGARNAEKAFTIVNYFEQNPKDNPVVLSVSMLYNLFSKIISIHVTPDKSDAHLSNLLKVGRNFFALNEYKLAARNYSLKEATKALELLLDVDLKSKGVGTTESNDPQILREFIYKILYQRVA